MNRAQTRPSAPLAAFLAVPLVAISLTAAVAHADVFTDIRYNDLVARLGSATPTGAGIGIGQVEAPENAAGSYAPDTANAEFAGKSITLLTGTPAVASWHATEVGKQLYGNSLSIARGVSSIYAWNVNSWVTGTYLRVGSGATVAPLTPPAGVRVFNHSWIGSFGNTTNDNDALRRLDYTVTRDNIFIAAGVNNGAGSAGQPMMAYAFNAIAVGLDNGNHSNSPTPTGIDGANRRKPDIVAPGQFTSFATPVVGAAAALLFETAATHPSLAANPNAGRPLTAKSVLMASTTHRAGWSNGAPTSGASRGIATTPLDPLYGADLLNIDRAHQVLTAGESNGATVVVTSVFLPHQGWDYIPFIASGSAYYYSFRIDTPIAEASMIATWHRQVATNFSTWNMQDIDLKLWRLVNGNLTAISGDAGASVFASGNCESASLVDNAEHLYLRDLAAGDYVLEVRRKPGSQTNLPVVVSWYMPDTEASVTGDLDGDGSVGAADLSILLNQWGSTGGPADLNADGIVNAADLAVLLANWG